jgi:hypothetical protein
MKVTKVNQQDLSKNAIKSVSYFIRTCVKSVCTRVLRVLDFFCILLLIPHFSVIEVSAFEFAVADDETGERRGYESIVSTSISLSLFLTVPSKSTLTHFI